MGATYTNFYQILTFFTIFFIQFITHINVTNARSLSYLPQNHPNHLVRLACKHTLYPNICTTSLRSDPRTKYMSSLRGIAAIALDLSLTQATQTQDYVNQMIKARNSTHEAGGYGSNLSDCQEEYNEAVDDLNDAIRAFIENAYDSVNELVSGAMTDCQSCLDGAKKSEVSKNNKDDMISSFVDKNEYFFKLCSNVLAILKLVG